MDNKRLNEINQRKIEIRSMLESDKEINIEETRAELEKLNKEAEEIRARKTIADEIKDEKVETKTIEKPEVREKMENKADKNVEYRNAFKNYVATGEKSEELRAIATNSTPIPSTIVNQIVTKLRNNGQILPLINHTHFEKGSQVPVSSIMPVATFVKEGATSDKQVGGYAFVTFNGYKLRCAVAVTLEVDTMALDDFERVISENIANAMTEALEQAIVSQDNGKATNIKVGKPEGILSNTPALAIETAAVDYDTLINAEAGVPSQYEAGSVYVMSKATFLSLKSVKDANKRPILDTNDIMNHTLLGRNVVLCDYLPTMDKAVAGDVVAFIFRMKDYTLNTALDVQIKQYEDNETDDIVRKAIMLVDGHVIDNSSLVTIKKKASA
jgi:HK97 family phage major capsid protein